MSSVDERVVQMRFENSQFKKGAQETQKALNDVNSAVDSAGKGGGLLSLSSNMQRVSLTASKMAVVTTTALATITNRAVNAGVNMAKSLTFDPIKAGMAEFESLLTKQNVIMNATGKSGKEVKKVLNDLNTYSDKTIYSFSDMTSAITKFTNAGVPLEQASKSIKGIANAAAFAGANSEEAGRGMYAFSQAMSAGYIGLQDWNQVENANMGTQTFKNTLLKAAEAAGTLTKKGNGYVTASGKFVSSTKGWRDSLQEQWATTEVMNKALGKYADTSTEFGKKAFKSAQEVRTFSAFMDTLKESLGSGWAGIFYTLSGGLKESTERWTAMSNAVGKVVNAFFNFAQANALAFKKAGGMDSLLNGIKNIASPIVALLKAVGTAWAAAFPSKQGGVGKSVAGLAKGFEALTTPLAWLAKGITALTAPLTAFFSILKIGVTIVKRGVGAVVDFVAQIGSVFNFKAPSVSGGLLGWIKNLVAAIGDAATQMNDLLKKGDSVKSAFMSSFSNIKMPSFGKINAPDVSGATNSVKSMQGMSNPLSKMSGSFKGVGDGFNDLGQKATASANKVSDAAQAIGNALKKAWDYISGYFKDMTAEDIVGSFNVAVLTTLAISITKFLNTLSDGIAGFAGTGDAFKEALGAVATGAKSLQTQARAKLILNIGIAFGILAASLFLLSLIPMEKMGVALAGMAGAVLLMSVVMSRLTKTVEKLDGKGINLKLAAVSFAILMLAGALLFMALAFKVMDGVGMDGVAKGLLTIVVVLKMFETVGNTAEGAAGKIMAAATAIGIMSVSMAVLAGALLLFKFIDWADLGKAGVALAALTASVAALAAIPYEGIAKVGLAMLTASTGMVALALALIMFKVVDWESMVKAGITLLGLTLALAALAIVGTPDKVAGFVAIAGAMVLMSAALIMLNAVDWESIGKMAVVLTVLLIAFAAFAAIMYLAAPIVPVIALLGLAMLALGAGLLAFSAAMAIAMTLAAAGVAAFAALGVGAAVAVGMFMQTLAAEAPILSKAVRTMLQAIIDTIVGAVPMIIDGIKRLWMAIVRELEGKDKAEKMDKTGKDWIERMADAIVEYIPKIVKAAVRIVTAFLNSLAENLGSIIQAGANLIIAFIQGVGQENARIADAAMKTVIDFINAMADSIENNTAKLVAAMANLGTAMIRGLIQGVRDMAGEALSEISGLAQGMVDKARSLLKIFSPSRVFRDIGKFLVQGLTNGIQSTASSAIVAVASMVSGQIAVASQYVSKFIQDLDQRAIAARAKADGLAAAAKKAQAEAKKTKSKADDRAANQMAKRAEQAAKQADAAESKAEAAKAQAERNEQYNDASTIDKARMRSEDAQNQLDAAKEAEKKAASSRTRAKALREQASRRGIIAKERKALLAEAKKAEANAKSYAISANSHIEAARKAANDAIALQKKAGSEAANAIQQAWDDQAKAGEESEKYDKMTDAEKAEYRRKQAEELQKKADEDLKKAKELAYKDLEAANALAQQAMDEAEQARQYKNEAESLSSSATQGTGSVTGTVVNLEPTEAAALSMSSYSDLYSAATAAAAAESTVQFNQYNTSPESLSPIEIYRQTNNLFKYAADKLAS